jgi:hypothetical protein
LFVIPPPPEEKKRIMPFKKIEEGMKKRESGMVERI